MSLSFFLSLLLVFAPLGAPSPAEVAADQAHLARQVQAKAQAEAQVDAMLARYSLLEKNVIEENKILRQKCSE